MSEVFLKLIREELSTSKLGLLTQQKYLEVEGKICKTTMRIHELDDVGLQLLLEVIKRINSDIGKYAEIRIVKSKITRETPENTVDYDVIRAATVLTEVEKNIISPLVVKHASKLLYYFTKPCIIGSRVFKKSDISELTVIETIIASIYECGRVLEKPIVKMISP